MFLLLKPRQVRHRSKSNISIMPLRILIKEHVNPQGLFIATKIKKEKENDYEKMRQSIYIVLDQYKFIGSVFLHPRISWPTDLW